mgnify:CR=1 FL=1
MDRLVLNYLYAKYCEIGLYDYIIVMDKDYYSLFHAFAIDFVIWFEEPLELFHIFLQVIESCVVIFAIQPNTKCYAWKWCRVFQIWFFKRGGFLQNIQVRPEDVVGKNNSQNENVQFFGKSHVSTQDQLLDWMQWIARKCLHITLWAFL